MIEFAQIGLQAKVLTQTPVFHVLMIFILLDIGTGIAKAVKQKQINSTIGINGILRHLLVIVVMTLVGIYLPLLNLDAYQNTVFIYMIIQYAISLLENWVSIGLPAPVWVSETLIKLNKNYDKTKINIPDVNEINIIQRQVDSE